MRIFGISGSLQAASSNTALLRAAQPLAGEKDPLIIGRSLGDLPYFNPDLDPGSSPPPVNVFRHEVAGADAVLIASPEYAHGEPGVLKNALDWLVGSGELYGKPVAVVCGSPRPDGGTHVRQHLEDALGAQGAKVVASVTIAVPRSDGHDVADDPDVRARIEHLLEALRQAR